MLTKNYLDFVLFKHAFDIFKDKGHLTLEGISKIVAIKDSINLAVLSDSLKEAFPNVIPFRPEVLC